MSCCFWLIVLSLACRLPFWGSRPSAHRPPLFPLPLPPGQSSRVNSVRLSIVLTCRQQCFPSSQLCLVRPSSFPSCSPLVSAVSLAEHSLVATSCSHGPCPGAPRPNFTRRQPHDVTCPFCLFLRCMKEDCSDSVVRRMLLRVCCNLREGTSTAPVGQFRSSVLVRNFIFYRKI